MGAAITVVALVLGLLPVTSKGGRDATANPTTTTTTTVVEGNNEPKDCGSRYKLALDENEKNRILSRGIQAPSSEEMRQEILTFNSHDVRGLMVYYNASPLGASSPITDITILVDGGKVVTGACFSETGMQKYTEWATLWKVAVIQPTDQMPPGWGNTGIDNGVPSSGASPTGDTSGWMVVFVDANGKPIGEHGVMRRCGNPVTPMPVAPPGKTDETPPIGGPPDTTTTVPGLTPKDPSRDVNVNPAVPDQVKGPGTTPVGGNPGPATPPVDSPSGCQGPCPTAPPPPPPGPGVTVPVSNGGNTGVTAPPTSAPPPAPPVTASPQTQVTSP